MARLVLTRGGIKRPLRRTGGDVLLAIFRAGVLTLAPVQIYSTIEQKHTQACFSGPSTQNAHLVLGFASHWHGTIFPNSEDGRFSMGKQTGEGSKNLIDIE